MVVNNGGNLSKEYFLSYLKLVMNAHNCTLTQAQNYMLDHFFKGNICTFGKHTYDNFLNAVNEYS